MNKNKQINPTMSIKINEESFKPKAFKIESKPVFVFKKDMYLINLIKKKVDKNTSSLINSKFKFPKINSNRHYYNHSNNNSNRDESFKNSFILKKRPNNKPNSFNLLSTPRQLKPAQGQKSNVSFEKSFRQAFNRSQSQFFDSFCQTPLRDHSFLKNKEIVNLIKKYRKVLVEDCNNFMTPKGSSER